MTPGGPLAPLRRALAVLASCVALQAHAGVPPWPDAPYSYYAHRRPLEQVLRDFAANFSLVAQLSPGLSAEVDGRFNTSSPTEFIDKLAGVYGLTWFTHAGTLHVSRASEQATRAIVAGGAGVRQMLSNLGVLDARFGWGELPEQGVVVVSGPPAYVRLVERTLAQLPSAHREQQVRVFRLRHASVDDRSITYRDQAITTPGVATVLNGLVAQAGAAGLPGDKGDTAGMPAGQRSPPPSIQADPRINAIIVKDAADRMPLYEELIAQLDVPTPLIEIEAFIIDVNSRRLKELGVAWSAVSGRGLAAGYGNVDTAIQAGTLAAVVAPGATGLTPATTVVADAGSYFVARLRLLEEQGDAHVEARPSILTVDNLGAVIDLSETFYIQTVGERVATVTPVTVGTTLRVTPRLVSHNGQQVIRLVVDIEDGQIESRVVDTLPTVRRSTVSTQAVVRRDESLLLGGYNARRNTEAHDKVPVLGDLPGIGRLFSSRSRDVEQRERLFLIRPKVIGVPGPDGTLLFGSQESAGPPQASSSAGGGAGAGRPGGRAEPQAPSSGAAPPDKVHPVDASAALP